MQETDNKQPQNSNDEEPQKRRRVRIASSDISNNRFGNHDNRNSQENNPRYSSDSRNNFSPRYNQRDNQNQGYNERGNYGNYDRPQRNYNRSNYDGNQNHYGQRRDYQDGGYNRQDSSYQRPYYNQDNRDGRDNRYDSNRNYGQDQRGNYGGGYDRDRENNGNYNSNRGGYGNQGYNRGGNQYSQNNRRPNNNNNNRDRGFSQNNRSGVGGFNKNNYGHKSSGPKKLVKPIRFRETYDPDKTIRLNKYLSNSGVCSRREGDSLIASGDVKVNGQVITEMGYKITYADEVTYKDKVISPEGKVYVLLNKPKNCVTTSDDPENRITVMDLVKNACPERIYPVGRLDRNTTGVLLLTNDGDLASKLMHPKFKKKKTYQVTLDRNVEMADMQAIADGIMLDDGEIHADSIAYVSEERLNEVGIEIHSGRNRIVRRIFEKLNYRVHKLDRVYFSGLTKKNLPRGRWRYLTPEEVNMLRMGSFE